MILPHPSLMIKSPSKEMLESEAELTKEPPATKTISVEREMPIEGLGGLPMPHRTFVPLPPICSNSTVHSEETSHRSDAAGRLSPDHLSDEDTKSTESIFLTQVPGPHLLPPTCSHLPGVPVQPLDG